MRSKRDTKIICEILRAIVEHPHNPRFKNLKLRAVLFANPKLFDHALIAVAVLMVFGFKMVKRGRRRRRLILNCASKQCSNINIHRSCYPWENILDMDIDFIHRSIRYGNPNNIKLLERFANQRSS